MNYSALEAYLPIFSGIPETLVKSPHIFVGTFLHTARQLVPVVKEDWTRLVEAGIRHDMLSNFEQVVEALTVAEAFLNKTRFVSEEIHHQWEQKAPQVYDFLEEFEAAYRYAYRHQSQIKKQVDAFVQSRRSKGGVNELLGLIQLGEKNMEPLLAIGFDITKLATATQLAYDLLTIYRTGLKNDAKSQAALDMRNRAFTYLDIFISDIKSAARYLYWDQPQIYSRYTLVYRASTPQTEPTLQLNSQPQPPTPQPKSMVSEVLGRKDRGPALSKPQPLPSTGKRKNRFRHDDETGLIEQSKF